MTQVPAATRSFYAWKTFPRAPVFPCPTTDPPRCRAPSHPCLFPVSRSPRQLLFLVRSLFPTLAFPLPFTPLHRNATRSSMHLHHRFIVAGVRIIFKQEKTSKARKTRDERGVRWGKKGAAVTCSPSFKQDLNNQAPNMITQEFRIPKCTRA